MKPSASGFRTAAKFLFCLLLALSVNASTPAQAQTMRTEGLPLPWFHTRAEKMARQACIDELPECRDSVREKLVIEQTITLMTPWVLLCVFLLIGAMYIRIREARRERQRHEAQRHHVQASTEKRARDHDRPRRTRDAPQEDAAAGDP